VPHNLLSRVGAALAATLLLLSACSSEKGSEPPPKAGEERMVAPVLLTEDAKDIHSYANPAEARVTHVALDLVTDFDARQVGGTATLDIQAADGAQRVVLDTKGLQIRSVTNGQGQMLPWKLGSADEMLGAPLTVQLNGARQIKVTYKSAPDAAALQWLSPEQTSGKKYPFLFSQGQAILNRTWIPTQDSPGIRQTWEARIVVPQPLKAVMSAQNLMPEGEEVEGGGHAFHFKMDKPVAPYLIALAVGDIAFQSLGPRTGVYAEPSILKSAANELVDTERMVEAAETLYGPYQWGRYDMIVLPPAFPFGGMENPRLTFLTPTVLAGDKSLVSLIAHELAHSWSGNLVTNATWADFWLNEGVTSYIEGRIMEEIYGREQAAQLIELGWEELDAAIEESGADSPMTQLHLDLADQDPDEGMSSIAYDKGAAFLRTIEKAVGRGRFDQWLRGYFDRHAFQPVTSALFLADLREHLIKGDQRLEQLLRLDEWVYKPGLPANAVVMRSEGFRVVDQQAQAFALGGSASSLGFPKWTYAQQVRFLNALPRELPAERLEALDKTFNLSQSGNSEVLFAWLQLAVANRYEPAVPALERFLTGQGRRKFIAPLFESLVAEGDWGRPIATRIYEQARPTYHSVTSGTIDRLLKEQPQAQAADAG
jgi:aminopeptidase N